MKRHLLCALLACATMACASNGNLLPTAATADEVARAADAVVATDPGPHESDPATTSARLGGQWLGAASSSDYVLVGSSEQFIGVWVDVPEDKRRAHVPVALTLTIDTSGSMEGDKIVRARDAARTLIQRMKDGDLVAVHAFSDGARELIAPTVVGPRTRQAMISTVSELSATGATNMYEALSLAVGRTRGAPPSHAVRRVVMISDGRATAGPTSRETLAQVAASGASEGVQVTVLGVGLDYDEDALNAIALRSSGRLYHLADSREMATIIERELGLLQATMATGAYVELVPAPGTRLLGASGVNSHYAGDALRIPLGTMYSGQRREMLVRYQLATTEVEGHRPIASARLYFSDPNDSEVRRVQEVVVRGELTTDPQLVASRPNPEVHSIMAMREAATVATLARTQVSDGHFEHADLALAKVETRLRQSALQAKNAKDKKRMVAAAQDIARSRQSVRATAKAPPKARPAAQRALSLELNATAMDAMGY